MPAAITSYKVVTSTNTKAFYTYTGLGEPTANDPLGGTVSPTSPHPLCAHANAQAHTTFTHTCTAACPPCHTHIPNPATSPCLPCCLKVLIEVTIANGYSTTFSIQGYATNVVGESLTAAATSERRDD